MRLVYLILCYLVLGLWSPIGFLLDNFPRFGMDLMPLRGILPGKEILVVIDQFKGVVSLVNIQFKVQGIKFPGIALGHILTL